MRRFWRSNNRNAKPQLPYGTTVYAIGDIDGRADLLSEMLAVIDADLARSMPPDPIEVFLGDYVDRGPDSSKTLDLLIQRSRTRKTVFLKGNHEAYRTPPASTPDKRDGLPRSAQAATAALDCWFTFQFQGSRSAILLAG